MLKKIQPRVNTFGAFAFAAVLLITMTATSQENLSGRTLAAPAANSDGKIKILVYHDMEGLAGQADWHTFSFRHLEHYKKGQEMLIADVNAVIDGLFSGGAEVVHVVDAHGSGNPDPDILLDRLDQRAQMVTRDKPFRQYVDIVEAGTYDAVACVGMHAKTGSAGFASHTFTLGMDIIMNDMSITETELIGYSWGRAEVPVIFTSGDDKLAQDLKTMPWLEYVAVKKASSGSTADLRPVDEVHREMREAAKRAVKNLAKAKVMKLTTPIRAALRVAPPASLEILKSVPGIDYKDNRASFVAADFQAAYDGVIALIGVATTAYSALMFEMLRQQPNGENFILQYRDLLTTRWLDVESGRWHADPPPEPPAGRKYYGAR